MITVTPSAASANGKPLQLQAIQLIAHRELIRLDRAKFLAGTKNAVADVCLEFATADICSFYFAAEMRQFLPALLSTTSKAHVGRTLMAHNPNT